MNPEPIQKVIEKEYQRRGDRLGWRLLYSPWLTVQAAEVAFIGLNPGSGLKPENQGELSTEGGSAYEVEEWYNETVRYERGKSPLQMQVTRLFKLIGQQPDKVLAGNLVPFRSKRWSTLSDPQSAIDFGLNIWKSLIESAGPELVILMGEVPRTALFRHFGVSRADMASEPAGWGAQQIYTARAGGRQLLALPHLSRFRLLHRMPSEDALLSALSKTRPD